MTPNTPTVRLRKDALQYAETNCEDIVEVRLSEDNLCTCPHCSSKLRIIGQDRNTTSAVQDGEDCLSCVRCGYSWSKRKSRPRKCPSCGSYKWDCSTNRFNCIKCGHEWNSTIPEGPARCPNCRSSLWRESKVIVEKPFAKDPNEDTLKRWICERYDKGMGCVQIAKELRLPIFKVSNLIMEYYGLKEVPPY